MHKPPPCFNDYDADSRMAELLREYPADLFGVGLYRSIAWANQYVACLIGTVISNLDITYLPTSVAESATLCRTRGFTEGFAPILAWFTRFRQMIPPDPMVSTPESLRAVGVALDPGNDRTAALLDAAARALPRFARGEATGEDLLLGPETVSLWLDYFDNSNPLYAANNRVAAIAAARRLAGRDRLWILELGAGAGSGTQSLLDELSSSAGQRIERYVVSEPSAFFRRRGERQLARYDLGLEFQSLDINRPWKDQGLADLKFDLVFAVNVLHVAHDLYFSLREIHRSLAPSGWLVAGECLRPFVDFPVYIEFVFRLLETFNHLHTIAGVPAQSGFLTPEAWMAALSDCGFTQTGISPDHVTIRDIFPHLYVGAVCALGGG